MTPEKLQALRIPTEEKTRSTKAIWLIFVFVGAAACVALFFAWPRESDKVRTAGDKAAVAAAQKTNAAKATPATAATATTTPSATATPALKPGESLLTVSGYIINRERIELSPRF